MLDNGNSVDEFDNCKFEMSASCWFLFYFLSRGGDSEGITRLAYMKNECL